MKYVVAEHYHDGGVYRLVFAQAHEHVVHELEDNPDFDPDRDVAGDNHPQRVRERTEVVLVHHEDVVWSVEDPRWRGMKAKRIAEEQRREVSEMLTRRTAEQERAEADAAAGRRDLGGAGVEL